MPARRLKLVLILVILGASSLVLLAWTQVWVQAEVGLPDAGTQILQIDGAIAAPALTALALAGFALAVALTIAGRLIRLVLGALQVLLGFSVFLAAFIARRCQRRSGDCRHGNSRTRIDSTECARDVHHTVALRGDGRCDHHGGCWCGCCDDERSMAGTDPKVPSRSLRARGFNRRCASAGRDERGSTESARTERLRR